MTVNERKGVENVWNNSARESDQAAGETRDGSGISLLKRRERKGVCDRYRCQDWVPKMADGMDEVTLSTVRMKRMKQFNRDGDGGKRR